MLGVTMTRDPPRRHEVMDPERHGAKEMLIDEMRRIRAVVAGSQRLVEAAGGVGVTHGVTLEQVHVAGLEDRSSAA